ncbi:MAG: hypothetical protein QOI84_1887 [Solirubrobacterales bacterium]|nr:hypothetical protein [Solirubrobacterales bacterium]
MKQAEIAEREHVRATEPHLRLARSADGSAMIEGAHPLVWFSDGPLPKDKDLVVHIQNLRDAGADLHDVILNGVGGEIREAGCEKGKDGSAVFPVGFFEDANELTALYKARDSGLRGKARSHVRARAGRTMGRE